MPTSRGTGASMDEGLVIGVDCGGTQTRAVLARSDGAVLGVGLAGPGNARDVGGDGLTASVDEVVTGAFRHADMPRGVVGAAFLGVAGVATEAERESVRCLARGMDLAPDHRVGVSHDLRIAQTGAFGGGAGMVLIVGTGSCCYGRAADGSEWRAGGWGSRLDDGGSAVDLGLGAIVAVIRESDGRGPPTVLSPRIMSALSFSTLRDVLDLLDGDRFPRRRVAELARLVTRAADEGDEVAAGIIEAGATELAGMVGAVYDNLARGGAAPDALSLVGGVLQAGRVFIEPVVKAIGARVPNCRVVEPEMPAVLGAALLATELLGVVTPEQRERLRSSGLGMLGGEQE